MKRVVLIHGWGGTPKNHWFPWLKKELENKDFEVLVPVMPDTHKPRPEPWINKIKEILSEPNEDTFLVGHSIGCWAILKYLQSIDKKVGGAVLVAPWFVVKREGDYKDKDITDTWTKISLDFEKIKQAANNFTAVFSDDDPDVPLEYAKILKENINSKTIIEHNKGHFTMENNISQLPSVLKELLDMSHHT